MTYREAVRMGETMLSGQRVADAGTDAWLLLEAACGKDRNFYFLHMNDPLPEEDLAAYASFLEKRAAHVPLQYITGKQEFMGLSFAVDAGVLIPRADTEILAEEAIRLVRPGMDVLDLCTGSGCLIVSILKYVPGAAGVATDISERALSVAAGNAAGNGVSAQFVASDLFAQVQGKFDVIVSNPPYIPAGEIAGLMPEVRDFEPRAALDGGEDGLDFYRCILPEAKEHLKSGGYLLLEIGCGQGGDVSGLMRQSGYEEIRVVKDLARLDRVVAGRLAAG